MKTLTIREVYDYLDKLAPFSDAENWDNSGLLVGSPGDDVTGLLLCLDVSLTVIEEAAAHGANLIFSHHPVIFQPLRNLPSRSPVYTAAAAGIGVICGHTNFDRHVMGGLLLEAMGFPDNCPDSGEKMWKTSLLKQPLRALDLARIAAKSLSVPDVRFYDAGQAAEKVAVCSGAGGSVITDAADGGCGALITGDVKHSQWREAEMLGISLIDAGHYYTEIILAQSLFRGIQDRFPELNVFISEADKCPYSRLS
ncbi:GTP cyclohydrolase 1 type 2 [Clostridia bacterium]|nr:GTP cyclohydrolase 1 type 2 [Clostridia bacterium]